jgi:anaerobic selenocysteine-containing dehydrogenase
MANHAGTQRIHGYCGLCITRCGTVVTVQDSRFVRLDPDPAHPTGQAICAKGRAAPELVYHPERLTHPLRRTRPKGDADPGWERISWDTALNLTAAAMRQIANQHRALPSLRRRALDPTVTLHPEAARARGIAEGAWVTIETPENSVRARAHFDADLDPRVVVGEHG